jgi:hypothetical protein
MAPSRSVGAFGIVSALTAAANLATAAWNIVAKFTRTTQRRTRRRLKQANESARHARAQMRRGRAETRDAAQHAYAGSIRTVRAIDRWREEAWRTAAIQWSVRRDLRAAARGSEPIIVGPWLGEVGYEALYWVAFVRWFADYYRVDRSRLIVVSRGGVGAWYDDFAAHYVELLDLLTPEQMAEGHARRRAAGDQKQLDAVFDEDVLARVRARLGLRSSAVCHPSTMFRALRRFWLGTESLQRVLDHTRYRSLSDIPRTPCPPLPDHYVAVKFYSGHSLTDDDETRAAVGALLDRVRGGRPIVALDTAWRLDEHDDCVVNLPGTHRIDAAMTPQNNLGVQTEVIRRADLFVGTCGSVAWLAPMLGTRTIAIYGDDRFLSPHLYAARQIYPLINAAPFLPVDVATLSTLGLARDSW